MSWVLLAAVCVFAYFLVAHQTSTHAPLPMPSTQQHKSATKALDLFHKVYEDTFRSEHCKDSIIQLYTLRDVILSNLHDMNMRLPNDVPKQLEMKTVIDTMHRRLHAYIENAKGRSDTHVFRGPLDEVHYETFIRAENHDLYSPGTNARPLPPPP